MNNTETNICTNNFNTYVEVISASICALNKVKEVIEYNEHPALLINETKTSFVDSLVKFVNFKSLLIDVN